MTDQSTQIGKYTLKQKLATGGMAEIWVSEQRGPGGFAKELVIKRILPHLANDEKFVEMFLDEARLAAQLHHPNIVQIFDLGESSGSYYIAMEYIRGSDLEQILRQSETKGSAVDPHMAARIVADACGALDYAHNFADSAGRPLNLVHRDISPQNILVSRQGQVKLVDFGVAKAVTSTHKTQTGAVKGKFAYMSPEQISGKPLDGRSDLFAMGIVLFEMLTGRRPFGHESELMAVTAIMHHPAPKPSETRPGVPAGLDGIVLRALEKEPGARFQSAEAMQSALEDFLRTSGRPVTTKDLKIYLATLFGQPLGPMTPSPGTAHEPPGPIPSPPASASTGPTQPPPGLYARDTRVDRPDARQVATERVDPGAPGGGIGAGLIVALVAVFIALGGAGYFLYTRLSESTADHGESTRADAGPDGTGAVAQTTPPPHEAPDAGQVTQPADQPDTGQAPGPGTPELSTATPDAGGTLVATVDDAGDKPEEPESTAPIETSLETHQPDTGTVAVAPTPDAGIIVEQPPTESQPDAGGPAIVVTGPGPPDAGVPPTPEADATVAIVPPPETPPDAGTVVQTPGEQADGGTPDAEVVAVAEENGNDGEEEHPEEDEEQEHHEERPDRSRGPGTLRVNVRPHGRYEILIDDRVVGRTPLPPQELSAGSHRVEVRAIGASSGTRQRVRIRPGRTETVTIQMD